MTQTPTNSLAGAIGQEIGQETLPWAPTKRTKRRTKRREGDEKDRRKGHRRKGHANHDRREGRAHRDSLGSPLGSERACSACPLFPSPPSRRSTPVSTATGRPASGWLRTPGAMTSCSTPRASRCFTPGDKDIRSRPWRREFTTHALRRVIGHEALVYGPWDYGKAIEPSSATAGRSISSPKSRCTAFPRSMYSISRNPLSRQPAPAPEPSPVRR